jgi:hypothetical protein
MKLFKSYTNNNTLKLSFLSKTSMSSEIVAVFSGFRDVDLKKMIEDISGRVVSSISKQSTHLIVKDMSKAGKKIEEANENGMTIMSLDEFLAHYHMRLPEKVKVKKTVIAKKTKNSVVSDEHSEDESSSEVPAKNTENTKTTEENTKTALIEIIDEETHIEPKKKIIKKIVKTKKEDPKNDLVESQDEAEPALPKQSEDEIPKKKIIKSKKVTIDAPIVTIESKQDISELKNEMEIIKIQMSKLNEKMMSLETAISKLS